MGENALKLYWLGYNAILVKDKPLEDKRAGRMDKAQVRYCKRYSGKFKSATRDM